MKVLTNKIRCNLCGEEVESTAQHDYVKCGCGACAVDGGRAYLRRTFRERGCYTELSLVEVDGVVMSAQEYDAQWKRD